MIKSKNFLIPTLNNRGYSPAFPDHIQNAFAEFASQAQCPVLDIGAAFGVASLLALEKGARVIANDLDIRHLEIIKQKAHSSFLNKLNLKIGQMPQDLEFSENSLSAVLIARVLHFMSPEEIISSLQKIFKWIHPKGRVFFVATTPYNKILESFIPVYNQRKKKSDLWPGLIKDVSTYQTMKVEAMSPFIHLLDKETAHRIFTDVGFKILELDYFPAECPEEWLYDGREFIGCIAEK